MNSSLSKAKCFNITTLIPKKYCRSSLPSDREQRSPWCHNPLKPEVKGGGADDPDQPETPHLTSSLVVARRTQIVRGYLMTIPRRSPIDGTEGKTVLPFKSILQQASDILSISSMDLVLTQTLPPRSSSSLGRRPHLL